MERVKVEFMARSRRENISMACPHLFGKYLQTCKSDFAMHIPSTFELKELCTTVRHQACPFYSTLEHELPQGNAGQERTPDCRLTER